MSSFDPYIIFIFFITLLRRFFIVFKVYIIYSAVFIILIIYIKADITIVFYKELLKVLRGFMFSLHSFFIITIIIVIII